MSSSPAVVLTREAPDNRELALALEAVGVSVREIPCVGTRWLDPIPLQARVGALAFPSRRSVRGLVRVEALRALAMADERPLCAAVGRATASELESHGLPVDRIASPQKGDALARLLDDVLPAGEIVAVIRGNLAGGTLEPTLEALGRPFLPVAVYENEEPVIGPLEPFEVRAVFVASPSAARRLCEALPWIRSAPFCAIGPTTAAAVAELGVGSVREIGHGLHRWVEALSQPISESQSSSQI